MPRKSTTNPLHWLPFPVDRWLGELAGGLRPEQKGALMDLLLTAWQQQPPCTLPDDPVYLAARSGLGSSWRKLSGPILRHFEATEDGRVICPWLRHIYDDQLTKYQNRSTANKENRSKRGPENESGDDSDDESGNDGGTNGAEKSTNGTVNGGQSIELEQSLQTASTAATAANAQLSQEEFDQRIALAAEKDDVKEIARRFATSTDRTLFYTFLVRASATGDRSLYWLASFRDWLNPDGMDGIKATPAILAQAIREYGMNGFLDEGCQPTAKLFRAFVIYVRDGLKRPVRAGSKNWKQPAGIASKPAGNYDTTGNSSAADRLTRELGNSDGAE